jgi:hypothetical protein
VKHPALIRPMADYPDIREICCCACANVVGVILPVTLHPAIAGRMTDAQQSAYIAHFQQVWLRHGLFERGDGFFAKPKNRVRGQIRHPLQRDTLTPLEKYKLNGEEAWGYRNLVPLHLVKGFKCPHKDCGAANEVRYN